MSARFRLSTLVLVASLALNGLVGGYLIASWWDARQSTLPLTTPREILEGVAARLPAAEERLLNEAIEAKGAALDQAGAALVALRPELGRILAAPTVDDAALRGFLETARQQRMAAGEVLIEVLADALPRFSYETRLKIVEILSAD